MSDDTVPTGTLRDIFDQVELERKAQVRKILETLSSNLIQTCGLQVPYDEWTKTVLSYIPSELPSDPYWGHTHSFDTWEPQVSKTSAVWTYSVAPGVLIALFDFDALKYKVVTGFHIVTEVTGPVTWQHRGRKERSKTLTRHVLRSFHNRIGFVEALEAAGVIF